MATAQNSSDLVLDILATLFRYGATTESTLHALDHLNQKLGTNFSAVFQWDGVSLYRGTQLISHQSVSPFGPQMRIVTAVTQAVFDPEHGTAADLAAALQHAKQQQPYPTLIFATSAGLGATCLATIFGVSQLASLALIFAAAGCGGLLRRSLLRESSLYTQAFWAAFLGGLAGSLATHFNLDSAAHLVAVCPAMVLVPGPQVLNACFDFAARRHSLGLARAADSSLTIIAIAAGIVLGLALGGSNLPATATIASPSLLADISAAFVVAACYPIYFSLPYQYIIYPCIACAAGHGLRWFAIESWQLNVPLATLLDCLLVATLLAPLCFRRHLPYAGVCFAAAVALVPGIYAFRAVSGGFSLALENTALASTVLADAALAVVLTLAIVIGLTVPYRLVYRKYNRQKQRA